jgi:hypothetical protein
MKEEKIKVINPEKPKRKPKRARGQAWDLIHTNLEILTRRIVTARGSLEDIQALYNVMAIALKYEKLMSTSGIAKDLEKKAKLKEAEAEKEPEAIDLRKLFAERG